MPKSSPQAAYFSLPQGLHLGYFTIRLITLIPGEYLDSFVYMNENKINLVYWTTVEF
jgi:hypothetical protein